MARLDARSDDDVSGFAAAAAAVVTAPVPPAASAKTREIPRMRLRIIVWRMIHRPPAGDVAIP
jgi:hypothetical protein